MNTITNVINDLKAEMNSDHLQKVASETKKETEVSLDDLGLTVNKSNITSESLQKIASEINKVDSLEEMVKVAEEAGNTDIASLVKIANTIGDKIADRVIDRISTKG